MEDIETKEDSKGAIEGCEDRTTIRPALEPIANAAGHAHGIMVRRRLAPNHDEECPDEAATAHCVKHRRAKPVKRRRERLAVYFPERFAKRQRKVCCLEQGPSIATGDQLQSGPVITLVVKLPS